MMIKTERRMIKQKNELTEQKSKLINEVNELYAAIQASDRPSKGLAFVEYFQAQIILEIVKELDWQVETDLDAMCDDELWFKVNVKHHGQFLKGMSVNITSMKCNQLEKLTKLMKKELIHHIKKDK